MGNKLRDVFNHDSKIAERGIKRILNQAYDRQDCITCKNSHVISDDRDFCVDCSISSRLSRERRWSNADNSEQYYLFYERKER